ncbi:putative peptidase (DUF1758) domain-containing protein [Phthorimaea operculella]|nr:putative peptidase (DUF1758) domain-containing protein [Phthorimaea operculella]
MSTPQTPQQNVDHASSSFVNASSGSSANVETPSSGANQPAGVAGDASCVVSMSAVAQGQALLSTALIKVTNNGKSFTLRALLDPCSQSSFITEKAAAKIGLIKTKNPPRSVFGLNNAVINITEHCDVAIKSSYTSYSTSVQCFIVPLITDEVPQMRIRVNDLDIPQNIQLADPQFFCPSQVDMLLGVDVVWDLIERPEEESSPRNPMVFEGGGICWSLICKDHGGRCAVRGRGAFAAIFIPSIDQDTSTYFKIVKIVSEITISSLKYLQEHQAAFSSPPPMESDT